MPNDEFVVEFDNHDNRYYLTHRGCPEYILLENDPEVGHSPNLNECYATALKHMEEAHNVRRFDASNCPTAADHAVVEFCGNCGYSNRG